MANASCHLEPLLIPCSIGFNPAAVIGWGTRQEFDWGGRTERASEALKGSTEWLETIRKRV